MILKRIIFLLLLPVFFMAITLQAQQNNWLQKGKEAEFRGEPKEALRIWYKSKSELQIPDASIGFEYIRVAAANELSSYYEKATEMYFWAISAPYKKENRVYIKQEIERLKPLTGSGIYRQWTKWWQESDDRLATDMKGYWIQLDPTPSTVHNERLTEHWKRIAYASEEFKRNRKTVFNADQRALPYIRYGEPDRKASGRLIFEMNRISEWIQRQIDIASRIDPDRGRFIETDIDDTQDNISIQNIVQKFQRNPEYEIWIYDRIQSSGTEPLIFIFGRDFETGEFRMHSSIDDLIPERAFFPDTNEDVQEIDFVRQGLSPAFMLQMMYYQQLIDVDSYFENRLIEMKDMLIDQSYSPIDDIDLQARKISREILDRRENLAPQHQSELDDLMVSIPVNLYQYRFLDEDNRPYMINFLESAPFGALRQDIRYNFMTDTTRHFQPDMNILQKYYVNHSLQVYDNEWQTLHNLSDSLTFNEDQVQHQNYIRSFYRIPHQNRNPVTGSAELINRDPDTDFKHDTTFPPDLRGVGNRRVRQPTPLNRDPETFEVSDLVLGYQQKDDRPSPFSFTVANDQTIPWKENLVLHFEVYHLERKLSGFTEFELTYRIFPVDQTGNIITDQEEFILTLNFGSEDRRVSENLEIQTASLPPGLYEMHVLFIDVVNGREINRQLRFEVIDEK